MLSKEEINEVYIEYKKDLNINTKMPDLQIFQNNEELSDAHIGRITSQYAELFIGEIFFDSRVTKNYLYQILYHEFTHIVDRLIYFSEIEDEKQKRNLLFPYNEFHAAQNEMRKCLGLFYNPTKQIQKSTTIYSEYKTETLKEFLNNEIKEFVLYTNKLVEEPSVINVQMVMYLIIYNIGYYSICNEYNIDDELFIDSISVYPYISNEIKELKELLINNSPSEDLCNKTHNLASKVTKKIASYYKLL